MAQQRSQPEAIWIQAIIELKQLQSIFKIP
jgi:hypothetical protein